jgi:hypothetical protein
MPSERQVLANRRNALLSTGPRTPAGKRRSKRNAYKHGLTAETVITVLEHESDFEGFQAHIRREFSPETTTQRELVARLASLLWRLRRATAIETGLLQIQAEVIRAQRQQSIIDRESVGRQPENVTHLFVPVGPLAQPQQTDHPESTMISDWTGADSSHAKTSIIAIAQCFLRFANIDAKMVDRLTRYEGTLWRQARQVMVMLSASTKV